MAVKTEKFDKFLDEKEIKCFQKEEIGDELETVVYRSFMEVEGQNLPIIVITDNSIYSMIRVQVAAKVVKNHNLEKVLEYINELNRQYKVFKYFVTEDGDLCLDSCIPSSSDSFDGELVYTIIDVLLKHLVEHYAVLMRKIWSENN
ncbi:YbjN domain-containing protein [Fusobacterium varium]|uniref:YbjN domain-containing protein n=1 Tax=Fusobacterium varium TaxID=856 RepID=UPI0024201ED9|nr:YbjN domain-containing protein [Fusobacterium varium]